MVQGCDSAQREAPTPGRGGASPSAPLYSCELRTNPSVGMSARRLLLGLGLKLRVILAVQHSCS
jgi:hypothetical protein